MKASKKITLPVAPTTDRAEIASRRAKQALHITPCKLVKSSLKVNCGGRSLALTGRKAQTLALLIVSGARGFTSGEISPYRWARRTSAYIYNLRKDGFEIVTEREQVGDASVGRYILTSRVEVVEGGGL